jgi:hypothetical protein
MKRIVPEQQAGAGAVQLRYSLSQRRRGAGELKPANKTSSSRARQTMSLHPGLRLGDRVSPVDDFHQSVTQRQSQILGVLSESVRICATCRMVIVNRVCRKLQNESALFYVKAPIHRHFRAADRTPKSLMRPVCDRSGGLINSLMS